MSPAPAASLLRILVIAYWIIGTLDVASALLLVDALPPALLSYQKMQSQQPPDFAEWLTRGWMIVLLIALIAGSLGVLRLRNWGRRLFAAANVLMFLSYPLLDVMVYTWFGGLFADLSLALTGAILVLSYSPAGPDVNWE